MQLKLLMLKQNANILGTHRLACIIVDCFISSLLQDRLPPKEFRSFFGVAEVSVKVDLIVEDQHIVVTLSQLVFSTWLMFFYNGHFNRQDVVEALVCNDLSQWFKNLLRNEQNLSIAGKMLIQKNLFDCVVWKSCIL